jgi:hypothetical protein
MMQEESTWPYGVLPQKSAQKSAVAASGLIGEWHRCRCADFAVSMEEGICTSHSTVHSYVVLMNQRLRVLQVLVDISLCRVGAQQASP